MPSKEIKALREEGKLDEALALAKTELDADPSNLWTKRNISWVHYAYLKQYAEYGSFESFLHHLAEIKNLELPADEKVLFDQVGWQVGKMVSKLSKEEPPNVQGALQIWELIKSFSFTQPSDGYSFLFKTLHKALKASNHYIKFADWWGFEHFRPEDFDKEILPNGRDVMATAEQAYITYAKHLLPQQSIEGETYFDREMALAFLPKIEHIAESYPRMQYPAYFQAKLMLVLGDQENILETLLPFVRKKKNDFWAWEILGSTFQDEEKRFACFCKALSCKSPEEMLVGLRQRMAEMLITKSLYPEAKTEIELLVKARTDHSFKIPNQVMQWKEKEWYLNAKSFPSNDALYKKYIHEAEDLLFHDFPEETVFVELVNSDKKMLNFIASDSKFGFFKYERFFKIIKAGDTIRVRFQQGTPGGIYSILTAVPVQDEALKKLYMKEVEGTVRIKPGNSFGFLDDVFIHPNVLARLKLTDGVHVKGTAMKSYNQDKKQWGWKLT